MLFAMFTLVLFTFFIMLLMAAMRIRSVARGDVPGTYYRLMKGHEPPEYVIKATRQFHNLLETPVLFYAAGVLFVAMDVQLPVAEIAAWSYVALRVVHACIHLTYNHPIHRLAVFALSTLCILVLWVILVLQA
jgi:hypothetical protein